MSRALFLLFWLRLRPTILWALLRQSIPDSIFPRLRNLDPFRLKNLLENTYAVVPGRVVPSLRVLMDSAEQAGFFKATGNRSKMVMPILGNAGAVGQLPDVQTRESKGSQETSNRNSRGGNGNGNGGDGGDDIPAALLGLLKELPPIGTVLAAKRRAALTAAFKSAIDFLYPEPDGEVQ